MVRDGLGDELERRPIPGAQTGSNLELTLTPACRPRPSACSRDRQTYHPDGATAIVMDPRNSEILAMANWPGFDPSKPGALDPDQLGNMVIGFNYEPGRRSRPSRSRGRSSRAWWHRDTTFNLAPSIQVADRTIEESDERGYVTTRWPTSSSTRPTSGR